MQESSGYQLILEEGEIKAIKKVLFRLGRKNLGVPDQTVENTLMSINEIDRLERMTEACFTVSSWKELLEIR